MAVAAAAVDAGAVSTQGPAIALVPAYPRAQAPWRPSGAWGLQGVGVDAASVSHFHRNPVLPARLVATGGRALLYF